MSPDQKLGDLSLCTSPSFTAREALWIGDDKRPG